MGSQTEDVTHHDRKGVVAEAAPSCDSGIVQPSGLQTWRSSPLSPVHSQNTHEMFGKEDRERQRNWEWKSQDGLGKGRLGGYQTTQGRSHQKGTRDKDIHGVGVRVERRGPGTSEERDTRQEEEPVQGCGEEANLEYQIGE